MTNSLSNASFKYTGNAASTDVNSDVTENKASEVNEQQVKEAQEKKEKAKALVEQKLSRTPIQFGMVANPIQTGKAGAVETSLPIGQTSAKTIDKFSVDQICADIDGYEEVQDDSGIKSLISNFMNKFTGNAATSDVNSTETQQLPAYSAGGLLDLPADMQLSQETIDVLKNTGAFEQMQNLSQAQITDKSQTEQLQDKMTSFGRMQEIQKKMSDPNVSAEEKTKLMAEAQELFAGTPKTTGTLPAGVVNTSAKVAENMTPEEISSAMEFVQSHATGIDDEDPAFKALPGNVQTYIKAVASDATKNHKNGVKPADYKMPNDIPQ